jgi:hypothetical protein
LPRASQQILTLVKGGKRGTGRKEEHAQKGRKQRKPPAAKKGKGEERKKKEDKGGKARKIGKEDEKTWCLKSIIPCQ